MTHYIAIIEDAGPDSAVGVWFPDLPGCFSAGESLDEAMKNAPEALSLYVEEMDELPPPRSLRELNADPAVAEDMKTYMFAVIEVRSLAHAAE
jgi:predicted RNase H-like HicB family nuclease